MQAFELVEPETVAGVLSEIAASDGQDVILWAGGTATTLLLKQGLIAPRRLVGLERVAPLRGIRLDPGGGLLLGAGTRLREIERSPLLQRVLPCLPDAAAGIGNVRVRNAATLGGHLIHADPAQDLPPLLLALDATVALASLGHERRLPLGELLTGFMETAARPDELLTDLSIPAEALARRTRYVKYTPRSRDDFATVGVACSLALAPDGTCLAARIAVGGAGPTARRVAHAEGVLAGTTPSPAVCREAAEIVAAAVEPWDDARGSAEYKRAMSRLWTERTLRLLAGDR